MIINSPYFQKYINNIDLSRYGISIKYDGPSPTVHMAREVYYGDLDDDINLILGKIIIECCILDDDNMAIITRSCISNLLTYLKVSYIFIPDLVNEYIYIDSLASETDGDTYVFKLNTDRYNRPSYSLF